MQNAQPASPAQLRQLAKLTDELQLYVSAADGEGWPQAITQDAKSFRQLVRLQARGERNIARYFKDFADNRLLPMVSWGGYRQELAKLEAIKAADINLDVAIELVALEELAQEEQVMLRVTLDLLFDGVSVGAQAADNIYKQPADLQSVVDVGERQAAKYGATLVKDINGTTAGFIQHSVAKSLALGEDVPTAQARLLKKLKNPVRAKMIAHTEAVNAYGGGINNYGLHTKAKGKALSVVMDKRTSIICRELDRKYGRPSAAIPVKNLFEWTGGSRSSPAFHVLCRTGEYLIY